MKKQYTKPDIIIEDFKIAQNISVGCGIPHETEWGSPTQWDKTNCGWNDGVDILWSLGNICTFPLKPDEDVDGLCYNNPEGGQSIFGSY